MASKKTTHRESKTQVENGAQNLKKREEHIRKGKSSEESNGNSWKRKKDRRKRKYQAPGKYIIAALTNKR